MLNGLRPINPPGNRCDHPRIDRHGAIVVEKDRPIEIDDAAELAHQERGRHRQRRAHHVSDHCVHPVLACSASHREAFSKATALVELDVHHLESAHEARRCQ